MNTDIINLVRFAVCAIGYTRVSFEKTVTNPIAAALEVEGTGFLIGPGIVMTCTHVLANLKRQMKKRRIPDGQRVAQFVVPRAGGKWRTEFRTFREFEVNEKTDLATVILNRADVNIEPVPFVGRGYRTVVGEQIALVGYGHGSVLLQKGSAVARFGPILQRGCIAALSPFDGSIPNELLLDLAAAPAASGSPVFLEENGKVMAVLLKAQEGRTVTVSVGAPIFGEGGMVRTSITEIRAANEKGS